MIKPVLGDVDRGRCDLAFQTREKAYPGWRGRAVEPLVRDALGRLLPDARFPTVKQVGGWWPRSNAIEIDLVGMDARPGRTVGLVGTIKWHLDRPLSVSEVDELANDATIVPGVRVGTPLVAVCPRGADPDPRL